MFLWLSNSFSLPSSIYSSSSITSRLPIPLPLLGKIFGLAALLPWNDVLLLCVSWVPEVVDPAKVDAFVDLLSIKSRAGEPNGFVPLEACSFLPVYSGLCGANRTLPPSSGAAVKDRS